MRVLIADDEEKICQLINNLINWEDLGMTVLEYVNDGIKALEVIKEEKPELVITDIRMPGYDGLEIIKQSRDISPDTEFIIISGYRHFEYAQNAIRYGVKNYLLKPVKKLELTEELEKIRRNYYIRQNKEENMKTTILLEQNKEKIRESFFYEVLLQDKMKTGPFNLEEMNDKYQYHFIAGQFQIVCFKIDGIELSESGENEYIRGKLNRLIQKRISTKCEEQENIWMDNYCYLLLNLHNQARKEIRHALKSILDEMLLQKDVLNNLDITIGLGVAADSADFLFDSFKTSKRAIENRLFEGTNRLIEAKIPEKSKVPYSRMFEEFNKVFVKSVEGLDEDGVLHALWDLQKEMQDNVTGYEVLQMSKEAVNLMLFTIKRRHHVFAEEGEDYFNQFCRKIENQSSFNSVMRYLKEQVLILFDKYRSICMKEENRPIREVKQFIREHYRQNVSLEMLGTEFGFNAAYLSTLFKKEAGCTFSEYLVQVRMEKAKELLRETDNKISAVCEEVGYSDLKNFTKNFKAYTGLRPNEYRKIYS